MTPEEQLLQIERQLWTNNAELYHDHLVDDAMLVFGETGPIGRDVVVKAIRQENAEGRRWVKAELQDIAVRTLAEDAGLLSYRAEARWHGADADISSMPAASMCDAAAHGSSLSISRRRS